MSARDDGVGRVLVASLHQAIGDLLPMRLVFYENWLTAEGLRGGTIGLAPLSAVLSFLRQEGAAYGPVMQQAGEYAAEWSLQELSAVQRTMIESAPAWLRRRLVARLAARLVRSSYEESRATFRIRRGVARITVRHSIFCTVREPWAHPLCLFYRGAFGRLFTLCGLTADVSVLSCRAEDPAVPQCVMTIALDPAVPAPVAADAA